MNIKKFIIIFGKLVYVAFFYTIFHINTSIFAEDLDSNQVSEANNRFAFRLYDSLNSKSDNIFFSPYSISGALSMTAAGAIDNTQNEILSTLSLKLNENTFKSIHALGQALSNISSSKVRLDIANSLWIDSNYELLDSYLELTKKYFYADLKFTGFRENPDKSRNEINNWVEEKTQDKIKNLLPSGSVRNDTRLILVNAVYFLGTWQSQFKKTATKDADFTLNNGSKVTTAFMNQSAHFKYMETEAFQLIEMPYEGGSIAMNILLPKPANSTLLDKVLNEAEIYSSLSKLAYKKVALQIPKFKTESSFQLPSTLSKLGIKDAFEFGKADFSGMTGNKDFFIGNVVHKAFVEVDESGTEAAAATAVIMRAGAVLSDPSILFQATRPFLFLIRDTKSGTILFMGRVNQPIAVAD